MQKDMLEDHKRTGAYHQAILNNRHSFQDKAVLDVGTGSGILAIFAAQAGARKVYAVEATDMAKVAKRLVDTNNVRRERCFELYIFAVYASLPTSCLSTVCGACMEPTFLPNSQVWCTMSG